MPNRWLVKTDPARLPLDALRPREVVSWAGVTQPSSLARLKEMRRADEVLVYHTGRVRAVVALAQVRKGAYPDPEDDDGKLALVDLTIVETLARPVRLAELRAETALAGWDLLRWPRLHVMSVPAVAWRRVLALSRRERRP